ncbi:unnamed protein product [Miscanthus lutarioriparius]|uniref:Protein kinase domain-containing protein n=1 Tax=Miscanthus lutarioriparius TaxID=422564 RepID=A0A811RGW7_9POAL|nr:unnamed protein product [Miscanthus lutarioriparius]
MIGQAARAARQNTKDCEHLACRVSMLAELVPCLQDPEARRVLAGLDGTLLEAHSHVMSCQRKGFASQLFSASRDIDRKIDTYLSIIPVISYIGIARRLDGNPSSRSQSLLDVSGRAEDGEFTLTEIVVATNNFAVMLSDDADSGTKVYKGKLYNGPEVLLGAARAVEHLHRHAMPLIIHGNIASSNILLDAAWEPCLSGFGTSVRRAAGVTSQAVEVAGAASCGGYADPEYYSTGHIKPASDVYGLGMVMLEVLTGQPPVVSVWDEAKQDVVAMTMVSFALPTIQAGRLGDMLDRRPAPQPTTWQQIQPLQLVANTAARCLCLHMGITALPDVVANLEQALHLL